MNDPEILAEARARLARLAKSWRERAVWFVERGQKETEPAMRDEMRLEAGLLRAMAEILDGIEK